MLLIEAGSDTLPGAEPPEILDSYPMPLFYGERYVWPGLSASAGRVGNGPPITRAYEQARDCLDEVDGHREWGVRVRHTEPASTARPDTAGLTGTQYLVRRRERLKALQQAREDVVAAAGRLRDALGRHSADMLERAHPHGVLANTAYLVEVGREAAFHAELEWFARELRAAGATVETSGPWPPYSFTDVELVAADG